MKRSREFYDTKDKTTVVHKHIKTTQTRDYDDMSTIVKNKTKRVGTTFIHTTQNKYNDDIMVKDFNLTTQHNLVNKENFHNYSIY